MKPEIKAQLEKSFLRAYEEAENSVEKETIFWNAYDLGIVLPRPTCERTKTILKEFHENLNKICRGNH
ncbi:MAG: hypothetical protein PHC64_10755 [Candidatus Gastranaerophilales bacterium]|nr:hypothetical protein [Candidatus Gastranaerophilales bacterium]